jgi:hypothetical protein
MPYQLELRFHFCIGNATHFRSGAPVLRPAIVLVAAALYVAIDLYSPEKLNSASLNWF